MRSDHGFMKKICVAALLGIVLTGGVLILVFADVDIRWPQIGEHSRTDGGLTVDDSGVGDGYIAAQGEQTERQLKLRIVNGQQTLTYDLNNDGAYEYFPLQMGNGSYVCTLYKNVSGNKYSEEGMITIDVRLEDENSPYLFPNQYVWYTEETPAVQKSNELCEGLESDAEKFKAICGFMESGFAYDYDKARAVTSGTLPDIDGTLESGTGICQDFSALMVCMLRVQGIPAKLVIGYADRQYHAWINAYVDGEWQFFDPTVVIAGLNPPDSYTVERFY